MFSKTQKPISVLTCFLLNIFFEFSLERKLCKLYLKQLTGRKSRKLPFQHSSCFCTFCHQFFGKRSAIITKDHETAKTICSCMQIQRNITYPVFDQRNL